MNFKEIKAQLREYSVGIAGAGGLGSNAAVALCRSGIGRLVIADYDRVDESNLNRQYFFRDQLGKPKAEALKENLLRVDPNCRVEAHVLKLGPEEICTLFASCDLLIEAFDEAAMKEMLIQTAQEYLPEMPLIAASGLAGWEKTGEIRIEQMGNLYICGDFSTEVSDELPPLAPKVGMVANLQANIALDLLLKKNS